MGIFNKLFGKKRNSDHLDDEKIIEAGACPNCWGNQSYDDKYIEFVEDQTKSNINHDALHQKAFVQQFIETSITGIRLKSEGDHQICPACKTKYKYVSSKAT